MKQNYFKDGTGEGNQTGILSLGSSHSAIELSLDKK
jgi:hypothetical protein